MNSSKGVKQFFMFRKTDKQREPRTVATLPAGIPRSHWFNEHEFILESINPSVIKVRYQEQTAPEAGTQAGPGETGRKLTGYFGIHSDWDPLTPFTWIPGEWGNDRQESIEHGWGRHETPDQALEALCRNINERKIRADAQRVNPIERQAAARQVLQDLLDEMPEHGRPGEFPASPRRTPETVRRQRGGDRR